MARKVFLATLPVEHKNLYNKYRIARNVANHKVKMKILKKQTRMQKKEWKTWEQPNAEKK